MSPSKLKALDDWPGHRPDQAAATVADVMQPPAAAVENTDHVAAAAYLMKHARTAALLVVDTQHSGRAVGIITESDIAQVVADGRDVNEVRIHELMTGRPAAIPAATSIRDAARTMLARGLRELPVTEGAGFAGIIDIADVCGALLGPAA